MKVRSKVCVIQAHCSATVWDMKLAFDIDYLFGALPEPMEGNCECFKLRCYRPHECCIKRSMDEHIAASLVKTTVTVLEQTPPSVPPQYDPR